MRIIYAVLLNIVFFIFFTALYVFIGFSAGLTSHHEGIWLELFGWLILFICILLHIVTFTKVWKKKDRRSYAVGLLFGLAGYAYLIFDSVTTPG